MSGIDGKRMTEEQRVIYEQQVLNDSQCWTAMQHDVLAQAGHFSTTVTAADLVAHILALEDEIDALKRENSEHSAIHKELWDLLAEQFGPLEPPLLLGEQVAEYRKRIVALKRELASYTTLGEAIAARALGKKVFAPAFCTGCGYFAETTEELHEHIRACEKHPAHAEIARLERELDEAREPLEMLEEMLAYHVTVTFDRDVFTAVRLKWVNMPRDLCWEESFSGFTTQMWNTLRKARDAFVKKRLSTPPDCEHCGIKMTLDEKVGMWVCPKAEHAIWKSRCEGLEMRGEDDGEEG